MTGKIFSKNEAAPGRRFAGGGGNHTVSARQQAVVAHRIKRKSENLDY
ncbi:MAG: hypothetical protein LBL07_02250 [Tannerella sp.]|jgi:hypothetical protein|nr:hypothetical protein [Tannerella sp.]